MSRPFIFLFVLLLAGCDGCSGGRERAIDISGVEVEIPIERLDQHLFHAHPDSLPQASSEARNKFGGFYRIYVEDILQGAPVDDPRLPLVLKRFVSDQDWSTVQEAIDSVFANMAPEQRDFEQAFRRLKAVHPDSLVPRIITFNSGFNYGIFPTDSVLGVGLEWFIGSEHPVIGMLAPEAFPQYVKERMQPQMLVPSAVKGWLLVHYMPDVQGADLLAHLVATGKVMALLDALLPDVQLHLKMAFTPDQLAWCEANEFNIWKEIVNNEMLYSKKPADIGRLMNDGPFTNGFPRESPGHIGEWIGYRMVRSYMEENKNIGYAELFSIEDPKEILKFYKPK